MSSKVVYNNPDICYIRGHYNKVYYKWPRSKAQTSEQSLEVRANTHQLAFFAMTSAQVSWEANWWEVMVCAASVWQAVMRFSAATLASSSIRLVAADTAAASCKHLINASQIQVPAYCVTHFST